MHKHCVFAKMI